MSGRFESAWPRCARWWRFAGFASAICTRCPFDALKPKPRKDIGHARAIDEGVADLLVSIKDEHRTWSVAMVIDEAKKQSDAARAATLPPSTVHRILSRAGVMEKRPEDPTSKDRLHFAYERAGELWMSDVMYGPAVYVSGRRKQKTYLICFLDERDARRAVCRLRALGEHERVSARAQAGALAAWDPAASVRGQRVGVSLAPPRARVRAPRHHAHPRAPLQAARQRQAETLLPYREDADEVGYLSYSSRYADLLFEVITRRYEAQRSILVSTNKAFTEWPEVFPHAACTVTLVDRLVHKSEICNPSANGVVNRRRRRSAARGTRSGGGLPDVKDT